MSRIVFRRSSTRYRVADHAADWSSAVSRMLHEWQKGRVAELDDGIRTHRCVPRNCWSGTMVNVQGFEMLQVIGRRELRQ